jgi:hypothetical protein
MAIRAGFLTLALFIWIWLSKPALITPAMALVPYRSRPYGRRAIITDVAVPAVVSLMVILAL